MSKLILLITISIIFSSCAIDYSQQVLKLKKAGIEPACINYIVAKIDKKSTPAEKLIFAKSCNNVTVFNKCGGVAGLEKNELKFLKCLNNIK